MLYITDKNSPKNHLFPKTIKFENWGSLGPSESLIVKAHTHPDVGIQANDGKLIGAVTFNVIGTIRYMTIHDVWFETDFNFLCEDGNVQSGNVVCFSRPVVGDMRAFEKAMVQTEIY